MPIILLYHPFFSHLPTCVHAAGVDFGATSQDIEFDANSVSVCTPLSILGSNNIEPTESFSAVFTTMFDNVLNILSNTTTINIIDNNGNKIAIENHINKINGRLKLVCSFLR